nr:hypothetical protein Iba_scaffold61283CG0010 [Ipomoea batatas]GMD52539.1 hypothetical protein Iba_scaffold47283CG0010 [Ipomoea batatas]GME15273.1 hypothetical protein Iba_scaffold16048CG0010 [Ipomoea batatas]GME20365.1 hypothetical protein Iba_scaffold25023CG0010 [Ipomoea batatas]
MNAQKKHGATTLVERQEGNTWRSASQARNNFDGEEVRAPPSFSTVSGFA